MLALAGFLAVFAVPAGTAEAAHVSASCSTHGLAFSPVRVVGLHADGVSCGTARGVAETIARDLVRARPLSVSGAEGFSMSQSSCTGCQTTTSVSITYADGRVTVTIRGGGQGSTTVPAMPAFPSIPSGPPGAVV
jgi:hypothetical protein